MRTTTSLKKKIQENVIQENKGLIGLIPLIFFSRKHGSGMTLSSFIKGLIKIKILSKLLIF